MKKILLTMAAALISCIAFAGTPTVLYERGGDGTAWSEADLSEWINDNSSVTQSIDEGLKILWHGTDVKSSWNSTKEINFTENSIITLTGTISGGTAAGHNSSYTFFKLGEIQIRLYGNAQKASVVIGEGESATETQLSGYKRGGIYNFTILVDQAKKDVSVEVSGNSTGTANGKIVGNLPNEVIFAHNRGGSEGDWDTTDILQSIKITEEVQEVAMAKYSVNYIFNGETIKEESGEMAVGAEVSASEPLTIEGQKYYFADGAISTMVIKDGNNNLDVQLRKAYDYQYTVKANVDDVVIATGTLTEGESETVAHPRYILAEDGTVWKKEPSGGDKKYDYTHIVTPNANDYVETLNYTEQSTDGICFIEAEDINDKISTSDNSRTSYGKGAYYNDGCSLYTLLPGTYNIEIGAVGPASNAATIVLKVGQEKIIEHTLYSTLQIVNTAEAITVTTPTDITIEGTNSSNVLDYILIYGQVAKATDQPYKIQYKVGDEVLKEIDGGMASVGSIISLTDDQKATFTEDEIRYICDSDDSAEQPIKSDGSTVITIICHKAAEYNYTVKANVDDVVIASGKCFEDESKTVAFSKYILTDEGKVYSISTKNYSTTVDAENPNVEVEYAETDINDGIFFAEAESVLAAIAKDDCSNMAGARAQNETEFCTLKPGIYKVTIGTYGSGSPTYTIKAGDVVVLEQQATGTKEFTSEEFSVSVETKITFQGGDSSRLLDYILITGKEVKEADYTLKYVVGEGEGATEIKTVTKTGNVGAAIVLDQSDIKPFQTEDATYTCVGNDAEGKIVTIEGTVVTITCKKSEGYVLHFVDKDDEGSHIIKDHVEIAATVGSPIVVPDEHKQEFECKEHGVLFEYDSDDSKDRTVSEKADIVTVYCKAVKADYTLDYVVDGKSIKKETKTGRVGDTAAVAPEDLGEFKDADGNLYVYTGEAPEVTKITRDGKTVVTLSYSKVIAVANITLDQTKADVEVGQSIELKATVTPADATNPEVTWESSDVAIATVDANGKVTGVSMGTVTITAKAGDKSVTCTVSVNKGSGVSFGIDNDAPVQVYDLNGRYVANKVDGLAAGYYIIRQGNNVKKVHIR